MIILEDGTFYLEKGDKFPLKCPKCGVYIPYSDDIAIFCRTCGHRDCHEEFSNVSYEMAKVQ
jgi:hypothetical protein